MRKFALLVWLADSGALVFLLVYIWLNGNSPDRSTLAGDLGMIWGAIGAAIGYDFVKTKWKARNK